MITKEEREKDRAICDAASLDWREGAVEKWHLYCRATHPERLGDERVLMRANEHFPYEDDVRAAAHCRNRLPLYIAAAAEMERRFEAVEALARDVAAGEAKFTHASVKGSQAAMRSVMRILRGEK